MNKTTKIVAGVIVLVLVVGLAWYFQKNQKPMANNSETIKIGVIATLTGVGAYAGQQEIRGLEVAKEEINSAGGINGRKIEFITEDSQADPAKAVTAFNKLADVDKVKFIIGDSWNSTVSGIIPIANQKNILLISPVASLNELSKDDMFFRTVPSVKETMIVLAEYASENNIKKVGILKQNTSFGVEHTNFFKEEFIKRGGEIVGEESFALTQTDLKTEITKIKAKNPDAIFNLHATGPMMGLLIKQAKELGVNVAWLGSYGSENASLVKQYPSETNGMIYPYFYDGNSSEKNIKYFVDAYKTKYNEQSDFIAANSYDALKILSLAVKEEGEDSINVKKYLLQVKDYKGGSGSISFDANGDAEKDIFMKRIEDSNFVKIK